MISFPGSKTNASIDKFSKSLSPKETEILGGQSLPLKIVELLNSLKKDEKTVAIAVLKSRLGISRDNIEKATGIDKRFVTRHLKKLIEQKIVIEKKPVIQKKEVKSKVVKNSGFENKEVKSKGVKIYLWDYPYF